MSTRIPLPGNMIDTLMKGVDTGSTVYSRAMQPILEREKQKQLEAHFQEQLKLQKAAAGRAAQAAADAHRKMDPMYEINQYQALENWIKGQQGAPQAGGQMPESQQPAPTQEMGQGMGMFSPQGMQEAQQAPMPNAPAAGNPMGGLNMDLLKSHPMLRGFAKKHLGFDPLAAVPQTPEEKQAAAIDLFKQKEVIKQQNKGGETPTNTVLTQNQQALQGIDTVLPMIDEMIKHPEKVYGRSDFDRSKRAAYNAKTSGMIDTLVAAQQLPKVQASIDLVEQQIRRGTGESTPAYIERLKDLRKDLAARRGKAQSVVKSRKINTNAQEDISQMSDDQLRQLAGGG